MKVLSRIRGYKPLAVTPTRIFLSKGTDICVGDHGLRNIKPFGRIPANRWYDGLGRVRLLARVLRLGVTSMIAVDEALGFLNIGSKIYRIDLETGAVELDFLIPKGRKALNLSIIPHPVGHGNALVFGEYYANRAGPMLGGGRAGSEPDFVNIWVRCLDPGRGDPRVVGGKWAVLDRFEDNSIDHIHAVVAVNNGAEIYALVGDTGANVGFWRWEGEVERFRPFAVGGQEVRATWVVGGAGALLYASDTQLEPNYLLRLLSGQKAPMRVAPIEGSSIYAGHIPGGIVFSTSVEPGMPSGRFLADVLETRPGPGILSNQAILYHFDHAGESLGTVFAAEKDWMPARLGQFGTFMMPSGMENLGGRILAYGNAVKGHDNCCLLIEP